MSPVAGAAIAYHSQHVAPGSARVYAWTACSPIVTVAHPSHSLTVYHGRPYWMVDNLLPRC